MTFFAANGSMNVTVVPGSSYTGLYAADGSTNVVKATGGGYLGAYHPCGAWWVTVATPPSIGALPIRAPDGSLYVSETPFTNGGQKVTVVSGSLNPSTATTFDPTHITGWTLSGGNLVATRISGNTTCAVYSVATTTASQKCYVELTCGQNTFGTLMGFAVDNTIATRFGGSNISPTKGAIVQGSGGYLCTDSVDSGLTALSGGWTTGDQVDAAIDTANLKIWFRKNNGIWNNSGAANPATNTGGFAVTTTPSSAYYFFLGADGNTGDNDTVRFSSASWINAAPAGFTQLA